MMAGVSKPQPRLSRVKISKAYQEALLDAVADTGAGGQLSLECPVVSRAIGC